MVTSKTREHWLQRAIRQLAPLFTKEGFKVPEAIRVSVGFPFRAPSASGQAWDPKCSADKTSELFVSPAVVEPDKVLSILLHEMVHAVVGHKAGHGKAFKRCALLVGLAGKMTSTHASDELLVKLAKVGKQLGEYPHARLTPSKQIKKQTTRLKKMQCKQCGCIIRTTDKWIELYGVPWPCPCGALTGLVCPDEDD